MVIENDLNFIGSVAAWQNILNGCGYPKLEITGSMDNPTVENTLLFQKKLALLDTGSVDLETWRAGINHVKLGGWNPETPPISVVQDVDISGMEVQPDHQQGGGPANKPKVRNPVRVSFNVPIYYASERGPQTTRNIYCGKAFADTVLVKFYELLSSWDYALVHLGVYNPRQARMRDGRIIQPVRWSNHAYGEAMDFKGVITNSGEGNYLTIRDMKRKCPDKLEKLVEESRAAIQAIGRTPEIVDEDSWYHIGLWPL